MTCPQCQQENPPQAKFRLECATPLARQCVSCGTPLPVMGKLLALDEALKPTLSVLLALLDVPVDDAAWRTLDPGQRRQLTLDGVRRLLLREAREQPLLLIFEDLHSLLGELDEALMTGTRALEIAGRLGDLRLRIPATSYLEQARGHLTTATAMYREMDMQFWLQRAESESRELGA